MELSKWLKNLSKWLKNNFLAGLLLILPFVVVIIVIKFISNWTLIIINPIVRETRLVQYTSNIEIIAQVIAGAFVFSLLIFLGYFYSSSWGSSARRKFGKFVNFIPLIGAVYLSVRQVARSIGEKESNFRKLVLFEYPRENVYSLGLLTSKAPLEIQKKSEENLYSIFVPNSPNPTGGRTVLLPESEFQELDMSVQKGMKLMLTTGMAFEEENLPEQLKEN